MNTANDLKLWLQKTIKQNVENLICSEEFYLQTISKDFVFQVDGQSYTFKQWMDRLHSFKVKMRSLHVSFEQIIGEFDKVATVYFVKGKKLDDTEIKVKIIALFTIKNDKITHCDELALLIKGEL